MEEANTEFYLKKKKSNNLINLYNFVLSEKSNVEKLKIL